MDNKIEIPLEHWELLSSDIREAVRVFLDNVADNINDFEPDYILSDKGQVAIHSINFGSEADELLIDNILTNYFKLKEYE
jgi:hypothetical protein